MTTDTLDVVASDHRHHNSRDAIRRAINTVARNNDGYVHISDVRPLLPPWVNPHQVGAYMTALVRQRHLIGTGTYRPSENTACRNRTRPAEVRFLAAPIPEEES